MSEKLKPIRCGCGGEAEIIFDGNGEMSGVAVKCKKCGITTAYYLDDTQKAIQAWNKVMLGIISNPCTTPNGAYTGGCTFTNTTDQNKNFHPIRDFMVGIKQKTGYWITSYSGLHCSVCNYKCETTNIPTYCPSCGARMELK